MTELGNAGDLDAANEPGSPATSPDPAPAAPVATADLPPLDPTASTFVALLGRKGSGKSHMASYLFATYPLDRIAVDPTADAKVPPDTKRLTTPLPDNWPPAEQAEPFGDERPRSSLRYVADPASPTYVEDMDHCVGLAFRHGAPSCCWIDEIADLTTANYTAPNFRRALMQGRHVDLTLLMCNARPYHVNPMVLSQADLIYVFKLPDERDRKRVAGFLGWSLEELTDALASLPKWGHLRYWPEAPEEDQKIMLLGPLPRARRDQPIPYNPPPA